MAGQRCMALASIVIRRSWRLRGISAWRLHALLFAGAASGPGAPRRRCSAAELLAAWSARRPLGQGLGCGAVEALRPGVHACEPGSMAAAEAELGEDGKEHSEFKARGACIDLEAIDDVKVVLAGRAWT